MDGAAEKTNRLRRDISIVLGLLMMEDKATASTEVFGTADSFLPHEIDLINSSRNLTCVD